MSKVAIMQPYFFPYIGYFQLMHSVDNFIVYDNIQYTKKGWINRNRILMNGKDAYISLPLKKDSDYVTVKERKLSETWTTDRTKMLNRITEAYRKTPYFDEVMPLVESCIKYDDANLFSFIFNSLREVRSYLKIQTTLTIASSIPINHDLKSAQKVIALCKATGASEYINPIGGQNLYKKNEFEVNGINLYFLNPIYFEYSQSCKNFIPWLSIIDVMMFNSPEEIKTMLDNYQLL